MSEPLAPDLQAFKTAFEAAAPHEQRMALESLQRLARQAAGNAELPLNPTVVRQMRAIDRKIMELGGWMFIYVEHITNPTIRFKVIAYDKETKMGRLKGEYGAEFSRDMSKESMAKYGYKLVRSEEELSLIPEPKVKAAKAKAAPPPVADEED